MKTYYINETKKSILVVEDNLPIERFDWLMATDQIVLSPVLTEEESIQKGMSEIVNEIDKKAEKVFKKPSSKSVTKKTIVDSKQSFTEITNVTKDNWEDFTFFTTEQLDAMGGGARKEYKKQYAKYFYYKKSYSGKETAPAPKKEKKASESGIAKDVEETPSEKFKHINNNDAVRAHPDDRIPKDLIQTYGFTAVKNIMEAKNRGIGYTAEEIYESGLPDGCGHLMRFHVQEIVEGLEAVNL